MRAMRNLLLVCLLGGLLAGCGFHLQGSRPLPKALHKISIGYSQPYNVVKPPLIKFLQAEAERRGGWVVDGRDRQASRLRILSLENEREVLSVSPVTGKAVEHLLSTAVEYELVQAGETLVPMDRIEVYRELLFNREQVIPREYQEEETRQEMHRELARLIFLRLEGHLAQDARAAR